MLASAFAWRPPAPPKATSANSLGTRPALDGDDAQRAEHRLVDHAHDRSRGLLDARPAGLGDLRDRCERCLGVQLELAAEQARR